MSRGRRSGKQGQCPPTLGTVEQPAALCTPGLGGGTRWEGGVAFTGLSSNISSVISSVHLFEVFLLDSEPLELNLLVSFLFFPFSLSVLSSFSACIWRLPSICARAFYWVVNFHSQICILQQMSCSLTPSFESILFLLCLFVFID